MESQTSHRTDWTPDQVLGALVARRLRLEQISLEAGYERTAAWQALRRSTWPEMKRVIAARLGLRPHEIWPSIFDENDNVRPDADRRRRPHAERLKHRPEPTAEGAP